MEPHWDLLMMYEKELRHLCRSCCRGRYDLLEDIWSDVVVERIEAIMDSWNPSKGASLKTHLIGNVRWYIFKWLNRRMKKLVKHEELNDTYAAPPSIDLSNVDEVQSILAQLSEYDRTILVLYHYQSLTFEEIGQMIGANKGTARNHYMRALSSARFIADGNGSPKH